MALVLAKPAFQKKREAELEREEPEPKVARIVAEAKAAAQVKGGGKGNRRSNMDDETLEQLVLALGRLVMQNSSELREIQAVCLTTFLIDAEYPPIKAGLEAGQTLHKLVLLQKAKKAKQNPGALATSSASASAKEVEEDENLGSPRIMVALAVLPAMAILPGMTPAQQQIMKSWWEKILDETEEEIAREIPVFRVRKPQVTTAQQKKGKKTVPAAPYAKIQFAVKDYQVQDILCTIMTRGGGMEKAGPAPRGFLERQARELLEKVGKKKYMRASLALLAFWQKALLALKALLGQRVQLRVAAQWQLAFCWQTRLRTLVVF